ncbi:AbiV family abortive infection protein [Patescibacteria group bacterium]|nr:AbiV family abortive infection protein [Patescibacteria group bacterium]
MAEQELGKGVDHICFHLALLALEEVGKAVMIAISYTTSLADTERGDFSSAFDDHEKKIFWALWGTSFRRNSVTKESIENARDLSKTLHERRLLYLYVDPTGGIDGQAQIKDGEANTLIQMTRARLEMEKLNKMTEEFTEEDVKMLTWFFRATQDDDMKKFIFSGASIKKFEELGNGKDWVMWLKEVFDKNQAQMRELTQKELSRQQPQGGDADLPKYKMTIRIQSQSHSIRNNAFTKWNAGIKDIKLYKSNRKDIKNYVKGEMIMELTASKKLQAAHLWEFGFFMAKTFINALNVATGGLFWWYIPKDIEKYYDEIIDLEVDKIGNTKLMVVPDKRLALGWDEMKFVLEENEMGRVMTVYPFFMMEREKLRPFLEAYAFALSIFCKIDVHFRVEATALHEFFKALKAAFLIYSDWDGKSDFKEAALKKFKEIGEFNDLGEILQLGLDMDPASGKVPNVTLTEVADMKLYCDIYMQYQVKQYFDKGVADKHRQE